MGKQPEIFNQSLGSLVKIINSDLPGSHKLDQIVKLAPQALAVKGCSLLLLDGHGRLIHAASHGLSERYLRKGLIEADQSLPETMEGKVARVLNAPSDERVQFRELASQEKVVSIMSAPVTLRGAVVGSLRVYSRTPREFTAKEEEYLKTVANLTGIILEMEPPAEQGRALRLEGTQSLFPVGRSSSLKPVLFAHPSEEEFARLLDFYQIEWLYEPRSFPLRHEGGHISEMFTPDFYLPGLDLYVEMTTLKPELTREKRQRVRRLRELYPGVNIMLLARTEYDRLLAKYGHGPLAGTKTRGVGKVLFSSTRIQRRTRYLAKKISQDYYGRRPLLIGVMKGVVFFMSDLMRYLTVPAEVDFMAISYFGIQKAGAVEVTKDVDIDPAGRHVILIEDIVDTGMTLSFILNHLRKKNPASLAVCTLFDKEVRRLADVKLDYIGFEVPDEFMVGYGLDYQEEYRNLPFVALLEPGTPAETEQSEVETIEGSREAEPCSGSAG